MAESEQTSDVIIWDRVVRSVHWLVAIMFFLNYYWLEAGETAHEYVGYAMLLLWLLRFIWGFIGSTFARFRQFFPTPKRLKNYLQSPKAVVWTQGHNPVGALMIMLILFLLLIIPISGWLQETDRFWGVAWPQEVHEISADMLMYAVIVHVISVLYMQHRTGVSLVKPMMIAKRKKPPC